MWHSPYFSSFPSSSYSANGFAPAPASRTAANQRPNVQAAFENGIITEAAWKNAGLHPVRDAHFCTTANYLAAEYARSKMSLNEAAYIDYAVNETLGKLPALPENSGVDEQWQREQLRASASATYQSVLREHMTNWCVMQTGPQQKTLRRETDDYWNNAGTVHMQGFGQPPSTFSVEVDSKPTFLLARALETGRLDEQAWRDQGFVIKRDDYVYAKLAAMAEVQVLQHMPTQQEAIDQALAQQLTFYDLDILMGYVSEQEARDTITAGAEASHAKTLQQKKDRWEDELTPEAMQGVKFAADLEWNNSAISYYEMQSRQQQSSLLYQPQQSGLASQLRQNYYAQHTPMGDQPGRPRIPATGVTPYQNARMQVPNYVINPVPALQNKTFMQMPARGNPAARPHLSAALSDYVDALRKLQVQNKLRLAEARETR